MWYGILSIGLGDDLDLVFLITHSISSGAMASSSKLVSGEGGTGSHSGLTKFLGSQLYTSVKYVSAALAEKVGVVQFPSSPSKIFVANLQKDLAHSFRALSASILNLVFSWALFSLLGVSKACGIPWQDSGLQLRPGLPSGLSSSSSWPHSSVL